MDPEPEKPRDEIPAPSLKERLAWWFGIYFAGQVPVVTHGLLNGWDLLFLFLFPAPLGLIFAPILSTLPEFLAKVIIWPLLCVGFAFYGWHLYATIKARTRRGFDYLRGALVIVVLVNQWTITGVLGPITN